MGLSDVVRWANRNGWRRLAASVVFLAYRWKGQRIVSAGYNPQFNLWEYHIGNAYYVSHEPSWFCSDTYFFEQLRAHAAHFYLPQRNDIVMDVGAGVGEETVAFARLVGQGGRVFSVEANPGTCAVLQHVVQKNGLPQVSVFNLAVTDKPGVVLIEDDSRFGVGNSIAPTNARSAPVRAVTVDEFVTEQNINRIDLLKVNIEGAEQLLVKGFRVSVSIIRNVAISCHDFRFQQGESSFFKTRDKVVAALTPFFDLQQQQTGDAVKDNYIYGKNKNFNGQRSRA
jgi:FkbM family methyltransferase